MTGPWTVAIGPGEAFGHVFEAAGTFTYHCTFHATRMVATITVKDAPVTPVPSGPVTRKPPAGTLPPNFSPFPQHGTDAHAGAHALPRLDGRAHARAFGHLVVR